MAEARRVWRFQLDRDYVRKFPELEGVYFQNHWVGIIDGLMHIREGYAWDGASPCWFLPFIGWFGVPNGFRTAEGVPQAYYATLVHDVLCQFRMDIPVDKGTSVTLFKRMLREGGFYSLIASFYANTARLLGPQNWRGRVQTA